MRRQRRCRWRCSHDGGDNWSQHQISAAANNGQRNPEDGCTIRTDSQGNAYVFGDGTLVPGGKQVFEMMSRSTNGGQTWSTFRPVAGPVTQPGVLDPVQGRPVIDGIAGARSDLAIAPSVDIANGAPTGADATDRIVMTYVSGTVVRAARVLHRVDRSRGDVVDAAGDRDRGRSWHLHRAVDLPERDGCVCRLQRIHDTVPRQHDRSALAGGGRVARRLLGKPVHADGGVLGAAQKSGRRPARVERERADGRVHRRLRVRNRDTDVRCRGLERHPERSRLPRDRQLPDGPPETAMTIPSPRLPSRTARRRSGTRTYSAAHIPTRHRELGKDVSSRPAA